MLEPEVVARLMERGTIEVAPLAYMRGRTLNDSFIILDEAQNTTPEQMKMFLTRLGFGSKTVVTGDVTQIDLPDGRGRSGLLQVRDVLDGIEGLVFVELGSGDVVRHRIVQDIVDAYERHDDERDRRSPRQTQRRLRRSRRSSAPTSSATLPVDVARWVRLAQLVLDEERVIERLGADAEMSLLFVDATTIAELNERFLGGTGPTDVLAFPIDDELPPSGRQPDQGGRGPGSPADPSIRRRCSATSSCARRSRSRQAMERERAARRRARAARGPRRAAPARLRPRRAERGCRMRRREQELLARFREIEGRA